MNTKHIIFQLLISIIFIFGYTEADYSKDNIILEGYDHFNLYSNDYDYDGLLTIRSDTIFNCHILKHYTEKNFNTSIYVTDIPSFDHILIKNLNNKSISINIEIFENNFDMISYSHSQKVDNNILQLLDRYMYDLSWTPNTESVTILILFILGLIICFGAVIVGISNYCFRCRRCR